MGSLRSSAQAHDLGHLATEPLPANRNQSSSPRSSGRDQVPTTPALPLEAGGRSAEGDLRAGVALPGAGRLARHRPRREDSPGMVPPDAFGPSDRLSLPGAEPTGAGTVHHLRRRPRSGPDRSGVAPQAEVRLDLALLPRCGPL